MIIDHFNKTGILIKRQPQFLKTGCCERTQIMPFHMKMRKSGLSANRKMPMVTIFMFQIRLWVARDWVLLSNLK